MATAASNAIPSLKNSLVFSVSAHAILLGSLTISNFLSHRGEFWGGPGGGSVSIGLVAGVTGVPLPRPDAMTTSRVVDESKGLYKAEPRTKQTDETAKKIPQFEKNKQQRYVTRASRVLEDTTPPPAGAIPYGQGGTPSMPYTQFSVGGSQAGLGFSGPGGEFAGHFPWYVEAVRRRVSSNWIQSYIDPGVRWAPRAVISFQVLRDGTIVNIELLRSSGNASVDRSAIRSIRDSSPLERLPSEYSGSHVAVEFWFDFRR
ncbi:MAG: TonB family protein [Acidobacteria bacterium]|nr:TonB family protein [Acidobacteriota bacterium]MBI3662025.1 TonB family protein [Acidobacteriota bacterium]